MIASLGIMPVIVGLLAVGTAFHLLYRFVVYYRIIEPLQDLCRRKSHNYRTFLKKRYKIGTHEATLLWLQIRDEYFKDRYSEMKIYASGIHLIYFAGLSAIPFYIWRFAVSDLKLALFFLAMSLILLVGGFLGDRHYEDRELRFLYSLDINELDSFASKVLRKKLPTSDKENSG